MELTLSLPGGMWQRIREVRGRVKSACAHLSEDLSAAASMVTGELVENAVKYGGLVPGHDDIVVRFTVDDRRICIEVSNGAPEPSAVENVKARIDRIRAVDSPESLYIGRLEELLRSSGESGGLGLYRIGFEGKFNLGCYLEGQVLTIRATRELS